MKKQIPGGFYFVLEGADGCGKTTQYNLLASELEKSFDVLRVREPGGTEIGQKIRSLLLDGKNEDLSALTELFLFSADRNHLLQSRVSPALENGQVVLSDRNFYSTEAYQGAGGCLGLKYIKAINNLAVGHVLPDLAIILDVDSEIGLTRARKASGKADKIEARALDYHQRVREAYRGIAKREKDCLLIDGSRDITFVHEEIYDLVRGKIARANFP